MGLVPHRSFQSWELPSFQSWEATVFSCFSCVLLFVTPWTVVCQALLGFSRQEYWSGLPCPPPGVLPDPGIEPGTPTLQADSLLMRPSGKLLGVYISKQICILLSLLCPYLQSSLTPSEPTSGSTELCFSLTEEGRGLRQGGGQSLKLWWDGDRAGGEHGHQGTKYRDSFSVWIFIFAFISLSK